MLQSLSLLMKNYLSCALLPHKLLQIPLFHYFLHYLAILEEYFKPSSCPWNLLLTSRNPFSGFQNVYSSNADFSHACDQAPWLHELSSYQFLLSQPSFFSLSLLSSSFNSQFAPFFPHYIPLQLLIYVYQTMSITSFKPHPEFSSLWPTSCNFRLSKHIFYPVTFSISS